MCVLNRCFSKLDEIATDMVHGQHLIYSSKLGEIGDSSVKGLHNIIPGQIQTLVGANLILRLQPKLALHHSYYPIDQLISVHASNLLPQLSLDLSLRVLYLKLLTLSLRSLELLCIIVIRVLVPRVWQKLICASIRNQMISV